MGTGDPDLEALCRAAHAGDKWSLAQLVSLFEDNRFAAIARRKSALLLLAELGGVPRARLLGVTGSPGSGKSTLIGRLALGVVARSDLSVAVVAVDPSSAVSKGALLGDRTRVRFPPDEARLFFRSQASAGELGGMGRSTFQVCRLLARLFDLVFIETVGIGQSEIEIQHLADFVALVLQPGAGDQIQFMKAGIMEIPDAFVINKCDRRAEAETTYHALVASSAITHPDRPPPPIYKVSAQTGEGLDALVTRVLDTRARGSMQAKERYFFQKWVRQEFGQRGLDLLAEAPDLGLEQGLDEAQLRFEGRVRTDRS